MISLKNRYANALGGRHGWAVLFLLVAAISFGLSLASIGKSIQLVLFESWERGISLILGPFSLFVSSITGYLALKIERRQAEQADADKEAQSKQLSRIDILASNAAKDALSAHRNTDTILLNLQKAEEVRRHRILTQEQRRRILRAFDKSSLGGRRVLWVDDVPGSIRHERDAFESAGAVTIWVGESESALGLLEGNNFDVVISDMRRAEDERAGYDLLDSLRREGHNIPFVVYSSSRHPEHVAEVLERGGQGATNDPVELFEVVLNEISSGLPIRN